jgi:hypothetical protein
MDSHQGIARLLPRLSLAIALMELSGCGSSGVPLGTVTGHVTKGGKPQPGITVHFEPAAGGRGSEGITDSSGYYELGFSTDRKGAILGQHNVSVEIKAHYNNQDVMDRPAQRFASEQREVKSGSNVFDFEIGEAKEAK